MVVLTRADILNGKFERQEVYIKILDKEISLRPLTDGEYNAVIAVQKDMGKVKTNIKLDKDGSIDTNKIREEAEKKNEVRDMDMELDMKIIEEKKYYADCMAAAYGLSNDSETFHPSDLKQMRPVGAAHEIAEAVMKISKLDEPEKVNADTKQFRKK